MRRTLTALLASAALAGGLAACGAPLGGGEEATVGPSGEITVRMTEYQLDPQDIMAPPGPLKIVVVNVGSLSHNYTITDEDGERVGATETVPAGSARTIFPELVPGEYQVASTIGNNEFLGMRGTLTVREEGENRRRQLVELLDAG